MSEALEQVPLIQETGFNCHPWLKALREQAFAQFGQGGFPSIREEEWRYTNFSALEKKAFQALAKAESTAITAQSLQELRLEDAWMLVLVDGWFRPELSDVNALSEGLSVQSLHSAIQSRPQTVETHLGQIAKIDEHNFIAFNTANFADGLFIEANAKFAAPRALQILQVVTQAESLIATRNLIVLGEQAELTVIESFVHAPELNAAYLSASATEVSLSQGARLNYYKLQAEHELAYHFSGVYVNQARDACFNQQQFAFGGLIARCDSHATLQQGAECYLNGLYSGVKRQHLDNHTRIRHAEGQAISREMYKGIMNDRSRGVFQGRVIVDQQAVKSDSQMQNRNLLLSDNAEADTKPQLEIYADDVKCSHGVTVGQLEEKSVFYLESRGIDAETARNMLTFAFANEMVEAIKHPGFHRQVLNLLLQRFPQEDVVAEWL